jgi:hypothetical protein
MFNKYYRKKDSFLKFKYFQIENKKEAYILALDICDDYKDTLLVFIKTPDCQDSHLPLETLARKIRTILERASITTKNIIFFSFDSDECGFNIYEIDLGEDNRCKEIKTLKSLKPFSFLDLESWRLDQEE